MNLFIFYIIVLLIILVLLFAVNFFLREKLSLVADREERSRYECGFEHNSLSRVPFSIRYFLLTAVFLVFDLEVVLLLVAPIFLFISPIPSVSLLIRRIFIIVLFIS